jgi:hypothetical protein
MPEIKKLNLDALRPTPRPMAKAPVTRPSESESIVESVKQPRRDWFKIGLACAVVFLLAYIAFDRGVIPTPGPPQPDIDADGLHVMLIQPTDEGGLSQGQKEFLKSAKVADWVTDNGGEFRAYPQDQDLANESEVWRQIRSELSPPNVVGVLNDRKLTKMESPNGIDEGIQALEGLRK